MKRQFEPTPIVCPCCGHVFGEQAYFQSFEAKVAGWLNGKIAPPATPGYDVFDCAELPNITIQVKYSKSWSYQAKDKKVPAISWVWVVKRLDLVSPDFFVLFGIDEADLEHCFLLSREDFLKSAWRRGSGELTLRVSAKEKSDRRFDYVPKIWRSHVPSPAANLRDAIRNYQNQPEDSMFMEKWKQHSDEIRDMHNSGMSQIAIGKHFGVSQTTIGRILRGVRR